MIPVDFSIMELFNKSYFESYKNEEIQPSTTNPKSLSHTQSHTRTQPFNNYGLGKDPAICLFD